LAGIVALPYRSATQSGVLHLAYTFGKAVIATRAGGLQEDVIAGRTGLLVDPGQPDQLAEALRACIADPEGTRRMGEEAKRLSQTEHAWSNVAGKILGVYERVIAVRPAADRTFRAAPEP
jgi:glycosyltransferase involved in cell wall biosynthesis